MVGGFWVVVDGPGFVSVSGGWQTVFFGWWVMVCIF